MRTYTREQVEQVVEGVVREADSAATVPEVSDVDEAYANGRMDGAREVLRRLDALPSTPVPSRARGVTEGFLGMLESEAASVRVDGDGVSPDSHSHQLRILMFRFPDGSLAPYVEATEGAPYAGECLMPLAELVHLMRNVGHMEAFQIGNRAAPNPPAVPESSMESKRPILDLYGLKRAVQRPRAATPTPEVAPYAKQDGTRRAALTRLHEGLDPLPTGVLASNEPTPEVPALKAEPHYRCADPDCEAPERPECGHVLTGRPPGSLRATCRKAPHGDDVPHRWDEEPGTMSPGPTAPDVVWTGDGVRVLADGTVWDKYAPLRISRECAAIARALAEAKREAAQHSVAGEAVRHAALNQSWAAAGGDVIAIHAALLASDTVDAVHEAAESMRERVKETLAELGFDLKPREVAVIDALPLEAGGEVPSTPKAELRAYPRLVDAVRTALAQLRDGPVGRVGDAITTLSDALEGRR